MRFFTTRPWLALALAVLGGAEAPAAFGNTLPNIVILYADDMGYGDLGANNPASRIPTPNLDRLAAQGMRFTDAHSSSGICTPSRYALLTGTYHWRKFHNIVNSFEGSVFAAEELTLPELLRGRGYRTACIGKWHLGWDWQAIMKPGAKATPKAGYAPDAFDWSKPIPDGPLAHGFDHYFGDDVPNFPPYTWIENDRVLVAPTVPLATTPPSAEGNWEARPGPMAPGWQLDAVMPKLTERAVAWLEEQKGKPQPFFLYFPFTSPHAPIVPTADFVGKSQAGGYGDFMAQTDDTVGQVLAALDRLGMTDNTLVIFTADNGPERYAHDRLRKYGHASMGPLRGLKRDVWEGGHRVPFLVRWPGKVKPVSVSPALLGQIDILATIAAIVAAPLPEAAAPDSLNALPVLLGEAASFRRTHVHNTFAKLYAVRADDWVYLTGPTGDAAKPPAWFVEQQGYIGHPHPTALYNLREDLGQRTNLVADQPAKAAELAALLATIRTHGHRLHKESN